MFTYKAAALLRKTQDLCNGTSKNGSFKTVKGECYEKSLPPPLSKLWNENWF